MLTGILSAMKNKEERQLIRQTWGSFMEPHSILFLVASTTPAEWVEEMANFQDLLVVQHNETYFGMTTILPAKVQTFFHAAATILPAVPQYVFKTDDDSFVHPYRLKRALEAKAHDYWGHVFRRSPVLRNKSDKWYVSEEAYTRKFYPRYCSGSGYVLSRSFLTCAVTHLADTPFMPMEDVGTGILAQKCRVGAAHSSGVYYYLDKGNYDHLIVNHEVKNQTRMLELWEKLLVSPHHQQEQNKNA